MTKLATVADFSFIYNLYMHPLVNPYLLYEPMSERDFMPIFNELIEKKLVYLYLENEQPVGMFKFVPMPHRNTHIGYLGGVGIHPDFAGQGYGKKMMQAVISIAKEGNFKRIELSTATFNERAIHLYESCGFEKEGILRNYTFLKAENRYIDEVIMSYLF